MEFTLMLKKSNYPGVLLFQCAVDDEGEMGVVGIQAPPPKEELGVQTLHGGVYVQDLKPNFRVSNFNASYIILLCIYFHFNINLISC
jgi:hypothetical protein